MKFPAIALSLLVSMTVLPAFADETAAPQPSTDTVQTAPATPGTEAGQPTQNNTEDSMVGRVEKVAPTAKDLLSATQVSAELKGSLSKKYHAFTYTLKNTHQAHIEILQGEVVNGVDETVVAAQELQERNQKNKIGGALLRGVAGGLSFIPYAGVAGVYAGMAANHATSAAANVMDAAGNNSVVATQGRFIRKFNTVVISPNQTYSFTTLVPKSEKPQFKLVFKDLKSNEIYDIQE